MPPKWISYVSGIPALGDFLGTNGQGPGLALNALTGQLYYLVNDVPTAIPGGGGGGGSATWGSISGTLSAQTDLQTALNTKEPTISAGTSAQYYRGDKTWQTLNKAAVGLSAVDNLASSYLLARTNHTGTQASSTITLSATSKFLGRITAGSGTAEELTPTQATALLNPFTTTLQGLTPASGGGTTNFLRADGSWAAPPGGGSGTVTSVSVTTANGVSGSIANPTTTPAITLTLGAITPSSVVASGTLSGSNLSGTNTGDQTITLTGDITGSGTGSFATSIGANKVTLSRLAQVATATFLGRITAATGNVEALTGTQATTLLDTFTTALKGLAPASGGGTSNFLRADGTWAAPSGGADPWTYLTLASDFPTTSATAVDVTGLAFTPSANTIYEFEALLLARTATATVGPRAGVAWPTGGTDGVADITTPTSATANVRNFGNINAAVLAPVGGLPNTTQSWPVSVKGMFRAGASPSGTVKLQLASETAGTSVSLKAGSYLKYRII